jgi:hypothetical protein
MFERHFNPGRLNGTVAAFPAIAAASKKSSSRVNRTSPFGNQGIEGRGLRDVTRAEFNLMGHKMRKMLSFGIAAALTIVAVAAWGAAGPRHKTHAKITHAEITTAGIDPIALMQKSTDLQLQQYDPF